MTKKEKIGVIDIDDTEENEDWLRTPETRKSEAEIHEALRKEHDEEKGKAEETEAGVKDE